MTFNKTAKTYKQHLHLNSQAKLKQLRPAYQNTIFNINYCYQVIIFNVFPNMLKILNWIYSGQKSILNTNPD